MALICTMLANQNQVIKTTGNSMPRTCMHYIFCFLYYYHKKQFSDNKKNQNCTASVQLMNYIVNFKNYPILTGFSIDRTIAFMFLENKCYVTLNLYKYAHCAYSSQCSLIIWVIIQVYST